jgi:hypothetical protein
MADCCIHLFSLIKRQRRLDRRGECWPWSGFMSLDDRRFVCRVVDRSHDRESTKIVVLRYKTDTKRCISPEICWKVSYVSVRFMGILGENVVVCEIR